MKHSDHEIEMALADLYKSAKYAIELYKLIEQISEAQGLEAWQQAKIVKAADYLSSVYHRIHHKLQEEKPEIISEYEKIKGIDGKACWKGYRYAGTKKGKDICIKVK